MKKESILNLIKYHIDNNDIAFRDESYEIAKEFNKIGDYQLSEYILSMIHDNNFVPQNERYELKYLTKLLLKNDPLIIPDSIINDLIGIGNAIAKENLGVNKFLFSGKPGSGKTEAVKQLGRVLNKDVYIVESSSLIDSKLGQTQKNINEMFAEINNVGNFLKPIVLFDEIDSLALDRINNNDIREMGRATSEILKGLDSINSNIIVVATTNLENKMDRALIRRFDFVVNFDRYERKDLLEVADNLLDFYLNKYKLASRDIKLFNKIINLYEEIPYPAELKNIIKTSIAFCNPNNNKDYLKKLYLHITGENIIDIRKLQKQGFTFREIEALSGKSKSSVARELK